MRTKHYRSAALLSIILFISFLFISCATKKEFLLSSVAPAARGYAKINTDKNKNYVIKVDVANLAEPARINAKTYVVWMDSRNGVKNLGQMTSEKATFGKSLKASLESKSPTKPERIFITAEDNGDIENPSGQIVLTTDKF